MSLKRDSVSQPELVVMEKLLYEVAFWQNFQLRTSCRFMNSLRNTVLPGMALTLKASHRCLLIRRVVGFPQWYENAWCWNLRLGGALAGSDKKSWNFQGYRSGNKAFHAKFCHYPRFVKRRSSSHLGIDKLGNEGCWPWTRPVHGYYLSEVVRAPGGWKFAARDVLLNGVSKIKVVYGSAK